MKLASFLLLTIHEIEIPPIDRRRYYHVRKLPKKLRNKEKGILFEAFTGIAAAANHGCGLFGHPDCSIKLGV
jgi:hypothetical protein